MKTKLLLLVGTLAVSTVLAACTPPAGVMPPGLTKDSGSSQDQTAVSPASPPTDTAEPTETIEPTETVESTETLEPTDTPEVTETPEATETAEATDEGSRAGCPGNPGGTPPVAGSLATAFQVSQDEIMGWFCKGFGFGEIKKAYAWAKSTGKTVDELFALKEQGMGWGEVAHSLDIRPGGKPCWAGPDHDASDPSCVKPGGKASKGNSGKNGSGKGNGNNGNNGNGNGKGGKP